MLFCQRHLAIPARGCIRRIGGCRSLIQFAMVVPFLFDRRTVVRLLPPFYGVLSYDEVSSSVALGVHSHRTPGSHCHYCGPDCLLLPAVQSAWSSAGGQCTNNLKLAWLCTITIPRTTVSRPTLSFLGRLAEAGLRLPPSPATATGGGRDTSWLVSSLQSQAAPLQRLQLRATIAMDLKIPRLLPMAWEQRSARLIEQGEAELSVGSHELPQQLRIQGVVGLWAGTIVPNYTSNATANGGALIPTWHTSAWRA